MSLPRQNDAVDQDLGAAADGLDDLRQHVHRAAAMIELAAAMVGDVDPFDAVIDRDPGVLGGGDALDRQRNLELLLDALDRAPVERRPGTRGSARGAGRRSRSAWRCRARAGCNGRCRRSGRTRRSRERSRARRDRRPRPRRRAHRAGRGAAHRAPPAASSSSPGSQTELSMCAAPNSRAAAHHRRGAGGMEAFQRPDRREHHRQPQLAPELASPRHRRC